MQRKAAPLPWSAEDDEVLREAVSIHGAKAWSAIACGLPRRSSKECRARWLALKELDATQLECKQASAPLAMDVHLVSTTMPQSNLPAATAAQAKSATGASQPASPQPLICRLPRAVHGDGTLLDEHLGTYNGGGSKETGRRRASPASKILDQEFEPLPPPVPSASQQNSEFARKRARLSPQAFLEEALSPHHMSVSSVCSPSVEICDALTLTGSEQLADDDAAGSDGMIAAAMHTDELDIDEYSNNTGTVLNAKDIGVPAMFCLGQPAAPTVGDVLPSLLQCIADEYCVEDEAFLQPRTPLILREVDADEISADPRFSNAVQQANVDTATAPYPRVVDDTASSAEQRLNVSPLATVLQGGRATDSVQRLIRIAQNLSLQAPESPIEPSFALNAPRTHLAADATTIDKSSSAAMRACAEEEEIDWKDRERGFLHRQLLHNLFFRHSCSSVKQDRVHSPSQVLGAAD